MTEQSNEIPQIIFGGIPVEDMTREQLLKVVYALNALIAELAALSRGTGGLNREA